MYVLCCVVEQVKKDEMMDKARETKDQASGFIQQTGEQMKNMAQGAADAVKNTVGMGDNSGNTTTTTHTTTARKH